MELGFKAFACGINENKGFRAQKRAFRRLENFREGFEHLGAELQGCPHAVAAGHEVRLLNGLDLKGRLKFAASVREIKAPCCRIGNVGLVGKELHRIGNGIVPGRTFGADAGGFSHGEKLLHRAAPQVVRKACGHEDVEILGDEDLLRGERRVAELREIGPEGGNVFLRV